VRQGPLIAIVGVLVFAGVGVATLPASLVVSRLPPQIGIEGASGSVWNGAATQASWQGAPLGALTWRAHPASLLQGRADYSIELTREDGFVRGRVSASFGGGSVEASDVELRMPITALSRNVAANAWRGDLAGTVQRARLENGWPVDLVARFRMSGLRPPGAQFEVGSYELNFDEAASTPQQLTGRVRDLEAPMVVRGQLEIRPNRSYTLEGEVAPKPGAPPEVSNAVAFLGPADASGRRQFTITGTF
jgi:general secretion pathway protein N